MWPKVRTGILVTLVTVLIWVWADAETQKDDLLRPSDAGPGEAEFVIDALPVYVAQAASGTKWTEVTGADVRNGAGGAELLRVRVRGPRESIDRLRDKEAGVRPFALVVIERGDGPGAVTRPVTIGPTELGLRAVEPAPVVTVMPSR